MSKTTFTCDKCKQETDAKPCEAAWGHFNGDFRTDESSGPVCPVCAVIWLIDNATSLEDRQRLSRMLG